MAPLKDGFAALLDELNAERASAMGRIGARIDKLVEEMRTVERTLPAEQAARSRAIARHEFLRQQAEESLWHLIVTREAIGLKRHDIVHEMYPIPGPLSEV